MATTIQYPGAHDTAFGAFLGHIINNSGEAIGSYDTNPDFGFSLDTHAFLYNNGAFSPPIEVPGFRRTEGIAINDAGTALVQADNGGFPEVSYMYDNGTLTNIAYPGASQTQVFDINNRDQIIGEYLTGSGFPPVFQSFIYAKGSYTTIQTPSGQPVFATNINDAGEVVGSYFDSSGSHGFTYLNGRFNKIEFPGATGTQVFNVNNRGTLTGIYTDASGATKGFIDNQGHFSTIKQDAFPTAINDAGRVIGNIAGTTLGFIYNNGSFETISAPVTDPTGSNTSFTGLNNRGDIIGTTAYTDSSGGNGYEGFIGTNPTDLLPAVTAVTSSDMVLPQSQTLGTMIDNASPNLPVLPLSQT
jgi:hypothetical protein